MPTLRLQGDVQMLCACDPAQGELKQSSARLYFIFPAGDQQWRSLMEEPSLLLALGYFPLCHFFLIPAPL